MIVTNPASIPSIAAYSAGTLYSLTATPALLDFGTTDPSITITSPGTWLIMAKVRLDYNAATFAAVRTATLKLRRTNNTAADLTNGSVGLKTSIITTLTFSMPVTSWWTTYTTTNSDDIIQIFGDISATPTAGSLDAAEAAIVALKIG